MDFSKNYLVQLNSTDNQKYDFFYRGRFLVRRIRHNFNFDSQKHETTMTLVKDSLMEELTSVDKSLETKPQSNDVIIEDFYDIESE